jgi:hypothetical protein
MKLIKKTLKKQEVISFEAIFQSFLRDLQNAHQKTATFIAILNNKVIRKDVLKEQKKYRAQIEFIWIY